MRMIAVTLLVMWLLAGVAVAQPGRLPAAKKLIEYGWDVPNPEFTAANIRLMEKRPFDGLIMRVAGGNRGNIFWGASGTRRPSPRISRLCRRSNGTASSTAFS